MYIYLASSLGHSACILTALRCRNLSSWLLPAAAEDEEEDLEEEEPEEDGLAEAADLLRTSLGVSWASSRHLAVSPLAPTHTGGGDCQKSEKDNLSPDRSKKERKEGGLNGLLIQQKDPLKNASFLLRRD